VTRSGCAHHVSGQPKLLVQLACHYLTDISALTFPAQVYLDGELGCSFGEGKDPEVPIVRSEPVARPDAGIPLRATALFKVLRKKDGT
jgi:hypothetical protein